VVRSFRDLELTVIDAVADVSVDSGPIDLVPADLTTSEFRDEHRGIHGALLSGKSQNSFKNPRLTISVEPIVYRSGSSGTVLSEVATFAFSAFPFSILSLAAAFFASVAACFFIAFLL
jgi:hypothetical protein